MKTKVYVSFNNHGRPWSRIREILEAARCHDLVEEGPSVFGYGAKFLEPSPELARLRAELTKEGLSWGETREHVYTPSELKKAPLLWLSVTTAPKGMGGPTYGTQYDLSHACPQCGTGAVQTSPLILKASEIPKKGAIFQTLDSDILVSPDLARALRDAGVTGLELREARSYKTGEPLPWLQLISTTELPPMAPATKGFLREDPCPRCGRDGYFGSREVPLEPVYSRGQVAPDDLPDVVHTYEHFGNSGLRNPLENSHFAQPLLLVKPMVMEIFRQENVRGVHFDPVKIVEP